MLKRTLFLESPCYLSLRNNQLVAKYKDCNTERQAPIEDLGFVIIDHPQISLSQRLIAELTQQNTAIVVCNERHLPAGMMLNLDGGYQQGGLFADQINASAALKKQLWKQTIQAKILNQCRMLQKQQLNKQVLTKMIVKVRSGDPDNYEAQAARIYWQQLFVKIKTEKQLENQTSLKRERYGAAPNNMLNYGYAILRAATARALIGSGLLPTFGIHHRNRMNPYCLADDIMEPFRPFVDQTVWHIMQMFDNYEELTTSIKAELLKTLTADCRYNDLMRPLMVGLSVTTASLARCFAGESRIVNYPELPIDNDL